MPNRYESLENSIDDDATRLFSFKGVEDRFKELANEKSLINSRLENEKMEYQKKLNEIHTARQDLLDKNQVMIESVQEVEHLVDCLGK
jgi:hypothetical protein